MSKSILIIDTPRQCYQCPCYTCDSVSSFCQKENKETKGNTKPDWCPLRLFPQKHKEVVRTTYDGTITNQAELQFGAGYNACIDEIIGEN